MNNRIDRYPSRGGSRAQLVPRLDPVVYAQSSTPLPLGLAPAQVAHYEQHGYMVLPEVFSADEVALLRSELDRLRRDPIMQKREECITEPQSGDIRSIFSVHEISPVIAALTADERLSNIARYLLADKVYIHQSRVNYKPGYRGKEFYWHSDFETWHVEDGMPAMRALSMSISLTENTPHNGPLMLMPGSHKHYAVCTGDTPANHFKASLKKQEYGVPEDEQLKQLAQDGGIVSALGKAGSVVIFECNTMHGSNSNITPDPRSNVFLVYNAVSNRVEEPFCTQPPRPEYICSRERIQTLVPGRFSVDDFAHRQQQSA